MNIYSATELLDIIRPFIPDEGNEGKVLDVILDGVTPEMMTKGVCIILGIKEDGLPELEVEDLIREFCKGIHESRVLELNQFLLEVGYGTKS